MASKRKTLKNLAGGQYISNHALIDMIYYYSLKFIKFVKLYCAIINTTKERIFMSETDNFPQRLHHRFSKILRPLGCYYKSKEKI
ncbi:hypothetical protein CTT39_07380 [Agrobacterium rosae]|nr:hypothetical protein CTT39_07380 [Agrobacterium rosae]